MLSLWGLARTIPTVHPFTHPPRGGRCGKGGAGSCLQAPPPWRNHARAAVADRSGGRAISPSSIISPRSARVTASATSWVTRMAVKPVQQFDADFDRWRGIPAAAARRGAAQRTWVPPTAPVHAAPQFAPVRRPQRVRRRREFAQRGLRAAVQCQSALGAGKCG